MELNCVHAFPSTMNKWIHSPLVKLFLFIFLWNYVAISWQITTESKKNLKLQGPAGNRNQRAGVGWSFTITREGTFVLQSQLVLFFKQYIVLVDIAINTRHLSAHLSSNIIILFCKLQSTNFLRFPVNFPSLFTIKAF